MKKTILTALLVSSFAFPAYAANDLALCKLRGQHIATQGVAYQPGVDVNGKAVVPADVNAAPSMVPDVVRIPLTVDLAQRLNSVPTGVELKADTGMVEIHKDGKVSFNGQDLTNQAAVVCGDQSQQPVPQQAAAPAAAPAPAVETAAPVPPSTPVAPATARPTKIVVPVDAPPVPMATVPVATAPAVVAPVAPRVAAPVTSRIDVRDTPITSSSIPADAVASPALPPQTLGQFTIPANPEKTNKILAAPATVSQAPTQTIPASHSRSNEDLAKDDEIIWGEGN